MQRRAFLQTGLVGLFSAGVPLELARRAAGHRLSEDEMLAARRERTALLREPCALPVRQGPLRLNANENPLGLSPAARQAVVEGLGEANRYPFAMHHALVALLARQHGVQPEQVVLGAGSSEVLQMAVQAFATQHATFVLGDPTFEDVPSYAEPWGLRLVRVPLRKDHAHDLQRMREAADGAGAPAVVYVCNPNNPTGTLTPAAELDDWIKASTDKTTFLIDEAYFEFAALAPGFDSMSKWIASRSNVIVTRTFSKVHGMAGLRLGYGLAHADAASRLRRLQSHNDCSCLALLAAQASLADKDHVRQSLESNARARKIVEDVLAELELGFLPSHANFVMHEIRGELQAYIARMREAGILVGRPFPPMLGHNRLSLGTPEEMTRFADTVRGLRRQGFV